LSFEKDNPRVAVLKWGKPQQKKLYDRKKKHMGIWSSRCLNQAQVG